MSTTTAPTPKPARMTPVMSDAKFLKSLAYINGIIPLLLLLLQSYTNNLGPNPVNHAIHITGAASMMFLMLTVAVTPIRALFGWNALVSIRRVLGLYAFFYGLVHFGIYVVYDRQMSLTSTFEEVSLRPYLQPGLLALLLMIPLAVTSASRMIDLLGPKMWKLLHRLTYFIAAFGVIHYIWLVKADKAKPIAYAVVLGVLLVSRFFLFPFTKSKKVVAAKAKAKKFWTGELKIASIKQETHNVKTFRLVHPTGEIPFEHYPGQYVTLQLIIEGKKISRSYTIASAPSQREFIELTIKRETEGLVSRFLHDTLKTGDLLRLAAPAGNFWFNGTTSTGKTHDSVLLIAGGVGITPLMSMTRYLTDEGWEGTVHFLYVAKSEADLIFKHEFEELTARLPRLNLCLTLTRAPLETMWQGARGRVSLEMLEEYVPDFRQLPIYLCGPEPMMDATIDLLTNNGVKREQIELEAFVSPPSAPEVADDMDATHATDPSQPAEVDVTITLAKSGQSIICKPGDTILDAAQDSGLDLPFECRSGVCGTCKQKLLSGQVHMEFHDALTAKDQSAGFILTCQAHPTGDVTLDA
ncbi:2Fe-2S iron-sulfur cluster-binding protein [Lacunimicrobium album]